VISWVKKRLSSVSSGLRSGKPLEVGRSITKLFLFIVAVMFFLPQRTDDGWSIRIVSFLLASPNEIGDTLAGIAGVLAFLWIIVTVWLQSQELAAQREELALTRREMKEQRVATQEMALAMSAQAIVLKDEMTQRMQFRTEEVVNSYIRSFISWVLDVAKDDELIQWLFDTSEYVDRKSGGTFIRYTKFDGCKNDDEYMIRFFDHSYRAVHPKDESEERSKLYPDQFNTSNLKEAYERLSTILKSGEGLSDAQKIRLGTMKVFGTREIVAEVLDDPSLVIRKEE